TCAAGAWTSFVGGGGSGQLAGVILSFFVAMGLLLACAVLAKQLGAAGASFATKWAGRLTFGLTAYGASAVLGGSSLIVRKTAQGIAPNSGAVRFLSNYALRPLERSRPDIRRAGVGAALGAVGLGEAAKPINSSVSGSIRQSIEKGRKLNEGLNRQYDKEVRPAQLRQAINEQNTGRISQLLGTMSDADLESRAMVRTFANNPIAAATLPQNRFDKLMQSTAISDQEKAE